MRIACWAHNYPPHPGGLEIIVRELGRALSALEHEVQIVSTAWGGATGVRTEDGVQVRRLRAAHFTERFDIPYPMPLGPGVRQALDATRIAHVHHIHGALYATSLLGARAARRCAVPLVLTEHVGFVAYSSAVVNLVQRWAWRAIGDRILRRAAAIVTYNERVQRWLEHRSGRPVHLAPNGVDLSVFRPTDDAGRRAARRRLGLPESGVLLLSVGRAAAKKNFEALLAVPRRGFALACCGAAGRNLPTDVADLGIVPHESMPDVYRAADALVHLGVGEGFPVALQEAAASGIPLLLLWDAGYARSIGRDDVLAIESLDALAEAVTRLVDSAELRARLGANSRRWSASSGSWERVAREYLSIYEAAALRARAT